MSGTHQRAAQAALESVRPVMARLDPARHPEELAADLLDAWKGIETALRSLVGGSALSGQMLIGELRQRGLLAYEQGHKLVELNAVRDRLQNPEYHPTEQDAAIAHEAFDALANALATAPGRPGATGTTGAVPSAGAGAASTATEVFGAPGPAPEATPAASPVPMETTSRGVPPAAILGLVLVIIIAVGIGGFLVYSRSGTPAAIRQGMEAYATGQRERARGLFQQAAREHPDLALPHVYLGRIAREEGDFATAGRQLDTAIRLDTASAIATREMGSFFLARGQQFLRQNRPDLARQDFDAARRFYVRSVRADPTDKSAQGFLGCALMRLGRPTEGMSWLQRAGQGAWSACATAMPAGTPAGAPGTAPPGAPPRSGP